MYRASTAPSNDTVSGYASEWLPKLLDAIAVAPSLIIEPGPKDSPFRLGGFEHVARADIQGDWPTISADSRTLLVNCLITERPIHAPWGREIESLGLSRELPDHWLGSDRDVPAQLLRGLASSSPEGRTIAALLPTRVLKSTNASPFRAWLAREHRLEWLIFFAGVGDLMSARPTPEIVLLVLRAESGPTELLRMVQLQTNDSESWLSEIAAVKKREGGEVGNGIVLRSPDLGAEAWTYQRFTRGFSHIVDDARGLGKLVKLDELFADVRRGMHRSFAEQHEADDGVPCFYGSSIRNARVEAPGLWLRATGVQRGLELKEGDCVLRSFIARAPGRSLTRAALIRRADLPATFDHTLIRLRPKAGVPPAVLELVVSFLNSAHFAQMLAAKGADFALSTSKLKQVEVPVLSANIVEALDRLSASEAKYEAWAEQCRDARSSIQGATSYSAAVQRLLAQEQIDFERVRAAEDSQTLDYRIRNDYPHPIALRRELIRQLDHGQERLDRTLLCAEHAMNLLALAAMVQLAGGDELSETLPAASLKAFVRDGKLMMDWGKARAVLREGLVRTAKTKDPLSLPFPALVRLTDSADDSFLEAEQRLRDVRNSTRHLEEIPPRDLESISRQASEDLEALLEALEVLVVTPLAVVDDYQMDPITRARYATLRVLRGISQAFPIERMPVECEVPRGAVGFVDHAGRFRSLSPWLVVNTCPKCDREEIFVFSKYDGKTVKYISMETGHASSDDRAAVVVRGLLGGESAALP